MDPASTSLKAGCVTGWLCCNVEETVRMHGAMAAMAMMPGVTELGKREEENEKL